MKNAARYARIASSMMVLAAALLFSPKAAEAGCCVVSGMPTSDYCDATNSCPIGTGGSTSPATCDMSRTSCSQQVGGAAGAGQGAGQTAGTLQNPIAICGNAVGQKCVQLIVGNIIRAALGVVGSIALLMMIYGGFMWLTSMGNSEKVEKGKATLIWATLGLVLIFGSYALADFIIKAVAGGGS
jgi:hypothetical protein